MSLCMLWKNSTANHSLKPRRVVSCVPYSAQVTCNGVAATWPRLSRWSNSSNVQSRNKTPLGRARSIESDDEPNTPTRNLIDLLGLPFRNLSPESDTDYFANGFVEDLTADLTRFASLRVLAAESAFALGQSERSVDDVAPEWDLDFLLTGSLRRGDENLRVGVQLVRVEGRETVWAERFDAPLEKVFNIQDQIAATVAGRLAVHVDEATLEGARRESVENLPAYECWLRGMDCLKRGTLEGDEESRPLFEQALRIDSHYARAYSGLSLSHFNEWTCHAWHLWDENEQNAFDYASQAARLDDRDAMVHSVLARVYRFRHQHRQADQHADRALALNPNDAQVLIQVAIVKLFGGEPAEGYELACKAMGLNPLHGDWYHGIAGWNLFMLGQYDEARRYLERAGETITNYPAYRAACAAIAGDVDRARREYDLFLREYRDKIAFGREPHEGEALTWAVQVEPFRRLEDSQRMPNALRDAGIATIDVEDALKSRQKRLCVLPRLLAQAAMSFGARKASGPSPTKERELD